MEIFDTLSSFGVVPVIALDDAAAALPLADALIAGGLPVAEITFRTEAAACAFEQGKYWEFQDLIFNNTGILGDTTYLKFAQQIGLDEAAFTACYEEGRYRDAVVADRDWASELGVSSTPTFFINGIALVGAQPYETFQQVIEMELAGKFTD